MHLAITGIIGKMIHNSTLRFQSIIIINILVVRKMSLFNEEDTRINTGMGPVFHRTRLLKRPTPWRLDKIVLSCANRYISFETSFKLLCYLIGLPSRVFLVFLRIVPKSLGIPIDPATTWETPKHLLQKLGLFMCCQIRKCLQLQIEDELLSSFSSLDSK